MRLYNTITGGNEKMSSDHLLLKKEDLELDLRSLGKEILRELFLSSRSLTFHSKEHLAGREVTRKPYNLLRKLFRLRSYFDFHLYQGNLYTMGIPQNDELFIRALKSELSRFSLGSVFIYKQVSPEELMTFLRKIAPKHQTVPGNSDLQKFLEDKKVSSIRAKKSEREDPFIDENVSLVNQCDNFQAGTLARLSLCQDPGVMLDILLKKIKKDIDLEGRVKLDFKLRVFQSVVVAEFCKLSGEKVKELLSAEFEGRDWKKISTNEEYLNGIRNLTTTLEKHAERESLMDYLKEVLARTGAQEEFFEKALVIPRSGSFATRPTI